MVGCVVLNYNDSKTTIELINRIGKMTSIDVIVIVDNNSTDDSFSVLKQYASEKIHVIQSDKNGGYGYGNNCGIEFIKKHYDCDYIIIANPDVIFEESVVKKMMDAFDEETVIVAPLTLDAKGNRQLPIAWKVPTIKDFYLFSSIVLNKFFNLIKPQRAYFGQKDAQQLLIVQKMVKDFFIDIEIKACQIVREADGLAISSRNAYLNEAELLEALKLSRALKKAKSLIDLGTLSSAEIKKAMKEILEPLEIDYIAITDKNLIARDNVVLDNTLILLAVRVGKTRLIDNIWV